MDEYEYEEFEDNDEEVRKLKLDRGLKCKKVLRFCVFKEIKEKEERMMKNKADYAPKKKRKEKRRKVAVASEDESSVQRSCCTSAASSDAKWSLHDSPLPIKHRSSVTGSRVPVSITWVHHPTKKRTAGTSNNTVQHDQERTNKCQETMKCTKLDCKEPSTASEQQGCSSSSEGRWSPDSPLVNESFVHHTAIHTTNQSTTFTKLKNRTKKRKYMTVKMEKGYQPPKGVRMKKKSKPQPPPPPPQGGMPHNLQLAITELGGTTPVWLAEKKLKKSDTDPHLQRLFIPSSCEDVLENYLTAEEKDKLLNPTDDCKGLEVMVVDASRKQFNVDFRFWKSVDVYVFTGNWKRMVESLGMKAESDTIQLWCFRLPAEGDSKLCFATNIERGP